MSQGAHSQEPCVLYSSELLRKEAQKGDLVSLPERSLPFLGVRHSGGTPFGRLLCRVSVLTRVLTTPPSGQTDPSVCIVSIISLMHKFNQPRYM